VAGLGAAAATWRKMPVPKNRPHDGSFSDRMNVETEEDADNKWKLNIKRGVSSAQNKATKEFEKYDRNTQMYQEFDSASRLQNEYDRKKGQISLMNKKYDFAVHAEDGSMTIEFDGVKYSVDLHGVVKNLTSGVSVDPQTAQEVKNVADFQRHAEQRIAAHEAKLNR